MLVVCVFATMFLSACIPGMSKEACMQDYKDRYRQMIIDHFTENEDIFFRITETLYAFAAGADDIGSYSTISLQRNWDYSEDNGEVKYTLFTARRLDPNDRSDITRASIDFLSDETINIYGLNEKELDKIIMQSDFDSTSRTACYVEIYCDSLPSSGLSGEHIVFTFALPHIYNRADRVDAQLRYNRLGIAQDHPDRINDNWYIYYSLYWSPAI